MSRGTWRTTVGAVLLGPVLSKAPPKMELERRPLPDGSETAAVSFRRAGFGECAVEEAPGVELGDFLTRVEAFSGTWPV